MKHVVRGIFVGGAIIFTIYQFLWYERMQARFQHMIDAQDDAAKSIHELRDDIRTRKVYDADEKDK